MPTPLFNHRPARLLFALCLITLPGIAVPAAAAQARVSTPPVDTPSSEPAAANDLAAIKARIAVVQARSDIPTAQRDLLVKQLQAAVSHLQAAATARKSAQDYAQQLQGAPQTLAALNADMQRPLAEDSAEAATTEPVQLQLELAALQTRAISLRGQQRELDESLRDMASRPEQARAELADLRSQLDQPRAALPANASPLQVEATQLLNDAAWQEVSARIGKTEQELLSLPVRESIATAQRDLTIRRMAQVEASTAAVNLKIGAQSRRAAERQAAQAQAFLQRLSGQPQALQNYARQTAAPRRALVLLQERLAQARKRQQTRQAQQAELADGQKSAEQILAIGRINRESGRLLRDMQAQLPAVNVLQSRIDARHDATMDLQVKRLLTRQELRRLRPTQAAAERYLTEQSVLRSPSSLALMTTLVEQRREALLDLETAQGQLLGVLTETNALDAEQLQGIDALRKLLDERLLWLPSAAPLGSLWLRQLGAGVVWLTSPAGWSQLPAALANGVAARWPLAVVLLPIIVALFAGRSRLVASLERLARDVGHRRDRFSLTLLACAATLLLALAWPLLLGTLGWLLRAPQRPGSFADAWGHGLLGVAIVFFMLGLFIDMCRKHGVFDAHFGWETEGARRLGRALRLLLLALVPAALLAGLSAASGRSELVDGFGRLGFMIGSLALALFLHRVFRPRGGALSSGLMRDGWALRTRPVWSNLLVAVPLLLAVLAALGYVVTARELQGRLFTSGWIILAVVIAFSVSMRGVLVVTRRTAWRQADERRESEREEAADATDAGDASETLNLQNQEPEVDTASVSQQTRALLRAFSGVLLAVLLWSIWGPLLPALNVFNDVALWSHVVKTGSGDTVAVVTLGSVLLSALIFVLTIVAARNLPGFLEVTVLQRLRIDSGSRYAIGTIGRYLILGIGLVTASNQIGADWSQLQWIVAALGVGLGFGLQEIVANFISGLIILFERPVRVGDLVSIGPTTGTVSRIKIRAITITDFDNFEVIVPNKSFITDTVQNWSLTNQVTRLLIVVRVACGSDVEQTQQIMLGVATDNPHVLKSPEPSAYFLRYGEHALEFELRTYVETIDERLSTTHALHVAMTAAFRQAGIDILFPQRDMQVRYADAGSERPGEA